MSVSSFIRRFTEVEPGVKQNFLMLPFLIANFAIGIAMVFFTGTATVEAVVLYDLTLAHLPNGTVALWGALAFLNAVAAVIGIYFRKKWLGLTVTQVGSGIWAYALILYALNDFWLQFFFVGVPNILFWLWWYTVVKDYHIDHDVDEQLAWDKAVLKELKERKKDKND